MYSVFIKYMVPLTYFAEYSYPIDKGIYLFTFQFCFDALQKFQNTTSLIHL